MKKLKYRIVKPVAVFLSINLLVEALAPLSAYALTSGPSQPEVQSFEPVATTEMVDLFSGDFTYNIPLFELPGPNGGYPFNLAYHSGIGMDQEASWVGLGWNLNPGVINRQMRGLPDDFSGDVVTTKQRLKDNYTFGLGAAADLELFGADGNIGLADLSLGAKIYYNSYRGVGYSLDPGINFHSTNKSGLTAGVGFNFSLDSQEGIGANASLSIVDRGQVNNTAYTAGIGYSSKSGLNRALIGVHAQSRLVDPQGRRGSGSSLGGSSALSFANAAYAPQVGMQTEGYNLDVTVKPGLAAFGLFANFSFSGFFTTQNLKNSGDDVQTPAYGYLHMENADDNALSDFNREKDGMIRKTTPNLAAPSMTYDIYNVSGQGINSMFRPYRTDYGTLKDPYRESTITSGAFGLDIGPGISPHLGFNASISYSKSTSGGWSNSISTANTFASSSGSLPSYYFKSHGELTTESTSELQNIGGTDPVYADIDKGDSDGGTVTGSFKYNDKSTAAIATKRSSRKACNVGVQEVTEKQVFSAPDAYNEFKVQYYPSSASSYSSTQLSPLIRGKGDHIAGFSSVNTDGTRYIYGIPALNTKQVECQYSVNGDGKLCSGNISGDPQDGQADGTEKYYNRHEIPAYAHSYLLTSVLGTDYVDIDGNGVSDNDPGYWVKFNYLKATPDGSPYKWRTPYSGGSHNAGYRNTIFDDKASYMYGEKEIWHVATVETKTHIAVFKISQRKDAVAAANENTGGKPAPLGAGDASYKIDEISLYTKEEYAKASPVPIKTVHFEYTYDLCGGTNLNFVARGNDTHEIGLPTAIGKLTLSKVYFTYKNNSRGRLNSYAFDYHASNSSENPGYNPYAYDRWGNYKPVSSSCETEALEFPYVDQPSDRSTIDQNAAVWNLKQITIPSGGKISINYESDDYAYVQDRPAMQMTQVASIGNTIGNTSVNPSPADGSNDLNVCFALKTPIPSSDPDPAATIRSQYLKGVTQLYFKTLINLKNGNTAQEYVHGYADIATDANGNAICGVNPNNSNYAFVQIKSFKSYHPFAFAAWQHLRNDQPNLAMEPGGAAADPGTAAEDKAAKIKSLLSIIPAVKSLFEGFYNYAISQGWGNTVDLSKTWIRLSVPNQIKYGGGCRVKQITMNDGWNDMSGETSADYGQVYDYTTVENGKTISSGVAQYEPQIGGDENPFRQAKPFSENIPFKTENVLFFEYPVNENYFPAASVGYSKVTVKSLVADQVTRKAAALKNGQTPDAALVKPVTTGSTGVTVNEFYTAKDFPIITGETDLGESVGTMKPYDLFVPVPLIGQTTVNNLTATQGYSIELNDMHGKPKMISNYRIDDDGNVVETPASWTKYNYQNDHGKLNNNVKVLTNEGVTEDRIMGMDYEFFTDMREAKTESTVGGLSLNTDIIIIIIPIPAFVPWPNVQKSTNIVRTAVTNKIIYRYGILKSTEAYTDESLVKTENSLFDAVSGRPLLTTVTNDFGSPVYKYNIPAHWQYSGMGPACNNIGYSFTPQSIVQSGSTGSGLTYPAVPVSYKTTITGSSVLNLVPGDKLLAKTGTTIQIAYVSSVDIISSKALLSSSTQLSAASYTFEVVRSGARNMISADAGTVTALSDPTSSAIHQEKIVSLPVVSVPDEYVDFLNNEVVNSSNPNSALKADDQTFVFANLKNSDGSLKYPLLTKIFKQMHVIWGCNGGVYGEDCNSGANLFDHQNAHTGYHAGYTFQPTAGGFTASRNEGGGTGDGLSHLVARKYDDNGTIVHVDRFEKVSDTQIRVYYKNNAFQSHTFCPQWSLGVPGAYVTLQNVLDASATEYNDNWGYNPADYSTTVTETESYALGTKGHWRPAASYHYEDGRVQSFTSSSYMVNTAEGPMAVVTSTYTPKISSDGVFAGNNDKKFTLFSWKNFRGTNPIPYPIHPSWVLNDTVTAYHPSGFEIENQDVLKVYSAAKYTSTSALPSAVGSNMKNLEMFFDGFEDPHSGFMSIGTHTAAAGHTGGTSLKATSSCSLSVNPSSFVGQPGKEYVFSCWYKEDSRDLGSFPATASIAFLASGGGLVGATSDPHVVLNVTGSIIEGWQKIEGRFTMPSDANGISVTFSQPQGKSFQVDDIRVFPFAGNMKSFVYNSDTHKLSATLDNNNYATFYYYDEEGKLFLIKRETEQGIKTIQESRSHLAERSN